MIFCEGSCTRLSSNACALTHYLLLALATYHNLRMEAARTHAECHFTALLQYILQISCLSTMSIVCASKLPAVQLSASKGSVVRNQNQKSTADLDPARYR